MRPAFLYALYLCPANTPLLSSLYIEPASRTFLVRAALLRQVRHAAEAEILKTTRRGFLDVEALYADAASALSALETFLEQGATTTSNSDSEGDHHETDPPPSGPNFFAGGEEAGLFDAEVFAYTYPILDQALLHWSDTTLADLLRRFPRLVAHRERMLAKYFAL